MSQTSGPLQLSNYDLLSRSHSALITGGFSGKSNCEKKQDLILGSNQRRVELFTSTTPSVKLGDGWRLKLGASCIPQEAGGRGGGAPASIIIRVFAADQIASPMVSSCRTFLLWKSQNESGFRTASSNVHTLQKQ